MSHTKQNLSKNPLLKPNKNILPISPSPYMERVGLPAGRQGGWVFGFTLVELIVVIVILAILATIAFLSFNSYSGKARDGNRLSNLKLTEKGLELSYISMGTYLMPEGNISTGTINGVDVAYNGYIGSRISNIIKLSTTPRDPVTNDYIDYGLTADKTKYQLAITLEDSSSVSSKFDDNLDNDNFDNNNDNYYSFESLNNNLDNNINIRDINIINKNLVESANADTLYQAKVIGNYVGNVKFTSGSTTKIHYLANIPSLIFNFSGSSTTDLLSGSTTYYVVNKNTNLPYKIANTDTINKKDGVTIVKEITNSTSGALVMVDITAIVNATDSTTRTNLINSTFSGVNLVSFGGNIASVTSLVSGGVSSNSNGGSGIVVSTIGNTSGEPGLSCNNIKTVRTNATDGLYWIKLDANPAFQVYCDMTTDGGRWTLIVSKGLYPDQHSFQDIKNGGCTSVNTTCGGRANNIVFTEYMEKNSFCTSTSNKPNWMVIYNMDAGLLTKFKESIWGTASYGDVGPSYLYSVKYGQKDGTIRKVRYTGGASGGIFLSLYGPNPGHGIRFDNYYGGTWTSLEGTRNMDGTRIVSMNWARSRCGSENRDSTQSAARETEWIR